VWREALPEACWIDTRPADPARFATVCDELGRLTALRPRRHLALALARRPEALDAALAFGRLVGLGGSGLGPRLEAIIGLAVAATLGVTYMGVHHAQALLDAGAASEEIARLAARPADGGSAGSERTVAGFCEKMARRPGIMGRPDVEAVRAAGFGDQDILAIAAAAAYEAFLCGVAAGLGVRLENEGFTPAARQTFETVAPA
jgi:alkylhydroperoxidase family enzyme